MNLFVPRDCVHRQTRKTSVILTIFGLQEWVHKVCKLYKIHEQRDCVNSNRTIHGTGCVRRPVMNEPITFDHQLMLGYHFPLGYFATLVTGCDSSST